MGGRTKLPNLPNYEISVRHRQRNAIRDHFRAWSRTRAIALICLLWPVLLAAQQPPVDKTISLTQLANEFETKAAFFTDRIGPSEVHNFTAAQNADLQSLHVIARQLVTSPDSSSVVLELLKKYNSHVGLARETLWSAVVAGRPYTMADLPYLKRLFLLSLDFRHIHTTGRQALELTPGEIRWYLGIVITTMTAPAQPPGSIVDQQLLSSDPRAWIERRIP